jgi:hypothetical protein
MKLTDRELEIFSSYSAIQRKRKAGAWIGLGFIVVCWVAIYYTDRFDSIGDVLAIFLGFITAELASLYFGVRPEDKMVDLLERYINNDAEALKQFSLKRSSEASAA